MAEQPYQAVLAVIKDGRTVTEVAAAIGSMDTDREVHRVARERVTMVTVRSGLRRVEGVTRARGSSIDTWSPCTPMPPDPAGARW